MLTINIKDDYPPADSAVAKMLIEIEAAKFGGIYAIKVIHGYGSHNVGGTIKKECHLALSNLKKTGKLTDFIKGEELSPNHKLYNKLKDYVPEIIIDPDLHYRNSGITVVII
ncbi:MAG: hypothetical protein LBN07_00540 [Christensenellaceae bacterium]|jgi:hypothetical protein|nr:hypothetical protein [Christensenellaceae bacterium]